MSAAAQGREAPALRVVIADNDPDALDLLDLDLGLEGHDVVGRGRNGTEAIALCRELNPDVLVVDFRMPPGPNGLAVVEELRDAGANDSLAKPIELERLFSLMRVWMPKLERI